LIWAEVIFGIGIIDEGKILSTKQKNFIDSDKIDIKKTIIESSIYMIDELLKEQGLNRENIEEIGIASPGLVSKDSIVKASNLSLVDFEICKELEEKINIKVKIRNDAKCSALAEKEYGALKGYDDCLFLCMGTGVGSAVFLGGKLLKAKQNPGFEFGHMIIDKDGTLCNCGKKGCFETYASMKRFKVRAIEELDLPKDVQSEEVQNFIRKNSHKTKVNKFIDKYLENVAIGVSNLINIFEPEAICFGGSFSYYDDVFLEPLAEKLKKYVFNKNTKVTLISAKLKNDAGIIGATEI